MQDGAQSIRVSLTHEICAVNRFARLAQRNQLKQTVYLGQFDWLREMMVEARVAGLDLVGLGTPPGECYQGHRTRRVVVSNALGCLLTVHPWHADIQDNRPSQARRSRPIPSRHASLPSALQEPGRCPSRLALDPAFGRPGRTFMQGTPMLDQAGGTFGFSSMLQRAGSGHRRGRVAEQRQQRRSR